MHDGRYETIVGSDVARDGMFSVLLLTMTLLVAGFIHLSVITVDESRAAELGCMTFLLKPFAPNDLLETLARTLAFGSN